MKPLYVTNTSRRGRAIVAAVASLLDLAALPRLDEELVIADSDGDLGPAWTALDLLCRARGLSLACLPPGSPVPLGFALGLCRRSWRNAAERHAIVLYDGAEAHDPDPGTRYPREIEEYYVLVPVLAVRSVEITRCAHCGDPTGKPQHPFCSRHWHMIGDAMKASLRALMPLREEMPEQWRDAVAGALQDVRSRESYSRRRHESAHRPGAWTPPPPRGRGARRKERRTNHIPAGWRGDE